jgi:hypothetical protein
VIVIHPLYSVLDVEILGSNGIVTILSWVDGISLNISGPRKQAQASVKLSNAISTAKTARVSTYDWTRTGAILFSKPPGKQNTCWDYTRIEILSSPNNSLRCFICAQPIVSS